MNGYDVLIVGAGMAGLMAARALAVAGKRVRVFDKGRSVGGRMATRRVGAGLADHGAQFFTVREPAFAAFVERWKSDGLVYEWSRGWSDGSTARPADPDLYEDGHPRYAVRGGMNALTQQLEHEAAQAGAVISVNVTLGAVRPLPGGGWQADGVHNADAATGEPNAGVVVERGDALVLTPPVPQSLKLLASGGGVLADAERLALEAVQYEPCVVLMLRLEGGHRLPYPGALQRPGAPLAWIADNTAKGIAGEAPAHGERLLTVHAGPDYSRKWYDQPDEDVVRAFRVDLEPYLEPGARIVETQVKRWRYSQPSTLVAERALVADAGEGARVVFAGDAFGGPRVEGAALSGLAAAAALGA
jgi:predicted NAD/FAD-dependent oxidoreductase